MRGKVKYRYPEKARVMLENDPTSTSSHVQSVPTHQGEETLRCRSRTSLLARAHVTLCSEMKH